MSPWASGGLLVLLTCIAALRLASSRRDGAGVVAVVAVFAFAWFVVVLAFVHQSVPSSTTRPVPATLPRMEP